jgi:hypothetical protein
MPRIEALGESGRQEIFRFLVSAQDMEMTVEESYEYIHTRFGLSADEIRRIEEEGVVCDWPPLC